MNSLKKLLLLVACAGVTGSAQATEQPRGPGAAPPAVMTGAHLAYVTDPGRGAPTGAGERAGTPAAAAAMPEPPKWMQLVCGLAIVAFMARRRARLPAD